VKAASSAVSAGHHVPEAVMRLASGTVMLSATHGHEVGDDAWAQRSVAARDEQREREPDHDPNREAEAAAEPGDKDQVDDSRQDVGAETVGRNQRQRERRPRRLRRAPSPTPR